MRYRSCDDSGTVHLIYVAPCLYPRSPVPAINGGPAPLLRRSSAVIEVVQCLSFIWYRRYSFSGTAYIYYFRGTIYIIIWYRQYFFSGTAYILLSGTAKIILAVLHLY